LGGGNPFQGYLYALGIGKGKRKGEWIDEFIIKSLALHTPGFWYYHSNVFYGRQTEKGLTKYKFRRTFTCYRNFRTDMSKETERNAVGFQ